MRAWESIQRTLEVIERRIDEDVPIEELARVAALSPFYFQRLFSRLVKKPVREYVRLRRLAGACERLRKKGGRILDVALDYGFGSHETFTRAFKEAYGFSPSQYRSDPVALNNFNKPNLALAYAELEEGAPLVSEGIALEINRRTLERPLDFVGARGHVRFDAHLPGGEVTGADEPGAIWARFHRDRRGIIGKCGGRNWGVSCRDDAPEG
ncbi:MAG: AraC family transcriptional regulator, partial [Treponema sp.]|nr:AraC family transcriptional regulator [Treponema sp.]